MKKGDVSIFVFITGIIAFFVILVIVMYLAGPGQNAFERLKLLLPSFNNTAQTQEFSLIVGYNIGQDSAKWYDGVEWHNFVNDLDLNGQPLKGGQVNYYLKEFWYNGNRNQNKEINVEENFQKEIIKWYRSQSGSVVINQIEKFSLQIGKIDDSEETRGDVVVYLLSAENPYSLGPAESVENGDLIGSAIHYIYKNNVKTKIFVTEPEERLTNSLKGKMYTYGLRPGESQQSLIKIGEIGPTQKAQDGYLLGGYLFPTVITTENNQKLDLILPLSLKESLSNNEQLLKANGGGYVDEETHRAYKELSETNYAYQSLIDNFKKDEEDSYGNFYLTLQNELKFRKVDSNAILEKSISPSIASSNIFYKTIAPQSQSWRDSVFTHPVEFKYGKNDEIVKYFCVKKFAGKDLQGSPTQILAIELNREKKSTDVCP